MSILDPKFFRPWYSTFCKPEMYQVQKDGSAVDQQDDASCWRFCRTGKSLTIAIADGATESIYSGDWAEVLVTRFARDPQWRYLSSEWLESAIDEFDRSHLADDVPWYVQNKMLDGSFATLLGVSIDLATGRGHVLSVGDCCAALLWGSDRDIDIFPLDYRKPIGSRPGPNLVASKIRNNGGLAERTQTYDFQLPIGEDATILLMTDALAAWCANAPATESNPWRVLSSIRSNDEFVHFVATERASHRLTNDDTTLVRMKIHYVG